MIDHDRIQAMLPVGWECERMPGEGEKYFVVLSAPNRQGYVTVDFLGRVFRSGMSSHGPPVDITVYREGRGWKNKLITDAVNWLQSVLI